MDFSGVYIKKNVLSAAQVISPKHLWYIMGYIVIFNRLAGIPNVVLLVPPMVHKRMQHILMITVKNILIRANILK